MDLICENSEERGPLVRPEEASQFYQMTSQHIIFGLKFRPYILLLREREMQRKGCSSFLYMLSCVNMKIIVRSITLIFATMKRNIADIPRMMEE